MKKPALVVALGLLVSACTGSSDDKSQIWKGDSVGIDFRLTDPTGQLLCEFSATREQLTTAQLDGLSSLRLHDAARNGACDLPTYSITIHAGDGSSASYLATYPSCSSTPILLFEDFDAWAKSTPCSLQP